MELTLDQALQKGIEAHKQGKVQEADGYYTAILKVQPNHPDANHNMGVLAVGIGKVQESLLFFKMALEANSGIEQFWLSYIDALIKLNRMDDAKVAVIEAESNGAQGDDFEKLKQLLDARDKEVTSNNLNNQEPPKKQLQALLNLFNQDQIQTTIMEASQLLLDFPNSSILYNIIGAANRGLGNLDEAMKAYEKAISIKPDYAEAFYNMGNALKDQGKLKEAMEAFNKAISIKPDYAEVYNNMGNAFKDQGNLEEAIVAYEKAISIKPDYAEAYNNMANVFQEQAKLKKAIKAFNIALSFKPDLADAYWNLSGTADNIRVARRYLSECLEIDPNHIKAKLSASALDYYQGKEAEFRSLQSTSFKMAPYMRSFAWAFSLPELPPLYFNRWALFDGVIELSKKDRPFYEFGVWRGGSFKYLIKTFKKGFGFDTFGGLPEDWHATQAGTYSSDGIIPKIKGGKFISGKFEDTLPIFFSEERPKASIINFDADLYSSTICALAHSKPIIDHYTILIFDEFLMNDDWEQDEFRALNEFCQKHSYSYKVIAISFFTGQVALRLSSL